ncbi:MAG TPA: APC family permease [Streptosporangiaceae bacterium]|nr:APC family permease [Streptosporangiaceae bacterium]
MTDQGTPGGGGSPGPAPTPAGNGTVLRSDLRANSLGLVGVTMQAITHIAPAIAALFFTQFIVSLAGITAPLAYVVGVIVVLMLGNTLVQFAKHLPSAGGYYTYVSRALSPRAGFITSWMYVLYSPLSGGPIYGFFGFILAGQLKAHYGIDAPWLWWACILVGAPLVAFLQYRGIRISARTVLILGAAEMAIVLALAITGFANPGPGGVTLGVFNFGNKLALSGFALAVVLSVQGLTGWEAAAPLAEETRDPKRNVPRSVVISIILLGCFLVFTFWGVISGFGPRAVNSLINSPVLPGLALADRHWSSVWWLVMAAFLSSTVAVCIATANVGTRMWYGMGRSGSFPKAFARVHPVHKTPVTAIFAQLCLALGSGLIFGAWFGADVSFFFVDGLILVLGVGFVYVIANIAVIRYYLTERRAEFNVFKHIVFPVVSTAVLIYAVLVSFQPVCTTTCPASPYNWAPVVDGGWLVLGLLVLVWYRSQGREDWIRNAGQALGEGEEEYEKVVGGP